MRPGRNRPAETGQAPQSAITCVDVEFLVASECLVLSWTAQTGEDEDLGSTREHRERFVDSDINKMLCPHGSHLSTWKLRKRCPVCSQFGNPIPHTNVTSFDDFGVDSPEPELLSGR